MASNNIIPSGNSSPATMSLAGEPTTSNTEYSPDDLASLVSVPRPGPPANTPAHTIADARSTVPESEYIRSHEAQIYMQRALGETSSPATRLMHAVNGGAIERNEQEEKEHWHENSTWESDTMDLLGNALARLATLARDEVMKDPSKSVQEYYSERLARAISKGEIAFDKNKL